MALDFFKEKQTYQKQTDNLIQHPDCIYDYILNLPPQKSDILTIDWKKMPSLPTNLQECGMGLISNHLIYFCGYSASGSKGKGKRGFHRETWGFDLQQQKWKKLPPFPSQGRQGLRTVVIDSTIYAWGGWTYQPMDQSLINKIPQNQWPMKKGCQQFHDGYSLHLDNSTYQWIWTKLPDLPDGRTNFGICHQDKVIYFGFGGVPTKGQMQTIPKYNHIYQLDIDHLDQGWTQLTSHPCPGTSRINLGMTVYNDYLYIIGGTYANSTWKYNKHESGSVGSRFYHVEDNWKLNLKTSEWIRLNNNPYRTGNWGGGTDQITYKNYLLLFGGAFFPQAMELEERIPDRYKPCGCQVSHCGHYNVFLKTIFAYDLNTDTFYPLESQLPGLLNQGICKIIGNQIHMIGGESYGFTFQGEKFPKAHLDLHMIGTIT